MSDYYDDDEPLVYEERGETIGEENDEEESLSQDDEFIYDQVNGGRGKRHVLSDLNKKKLNKHELDDIFAQLN